MIIKDKCMKFFIYTLLILLSLRLNAADFVSDTARANVSEYISLPLNISVEGANVKQISITGEFKLSNPTVFYPEYFEINDSVGNLYGAVIENYKLERHNDSMYSFELNIGFENGQDSPEILVCHCGEALAGSDSICYVDYYDVQINSEGIPGTTGTIIIQSIGPPLPYVRFARLERNYPNPIGRGETTKWVYRIDKKSRVRFYLFDSAGQEKQIGDFPGMEIGIHEFNYTPDYTMCTGSYILLMVTNSGTEMDNFIILK